MPIAQTFQSCLRLAAAPLRKGQLTAPLRPPIKKQIAANSNGGMLPDAVVSRARNDQVMMAKKPMPVAVLERNDLSFPVDGEIDRVKAGRSTNEQSVEFCTAPADICYKLRNFHFADERAVRQVAVNAITS